MANILSNLAAERRALSPESTAYLTRSADAKWHSHSWKEVAKNVDQAAFAFETLGLRPQQMVAVFSANRPQMIVTDLAAYRNRAVPVALYSTSSPEQVEYILKDCGASIAFAGDQRQFDILNAAREHCRALRHIIIYSEDVEYDRKDRHVMTYENFLALGAAASRMCRQEVEMRTRQASPDDLATLIYTSGTTGEPKGAMLPHSCFNACLKIHREYLTMLSPEMSSLAFLPLSHIFEKAWTYFCLYTGIEVYINPDPKMIQDAIKEVRPSCMCSVPRFWEKAYAVIQDKLSRVSGFKKKMMLKALRVGAERNLRYARLGLKAPMLLEMQYRFFDRQIFAPVRQAMGVDQGVIFPTAGAPLSNNIVEFFHSIGVNIVIGYGLSETTATVTCYPQTGWQIGTVGTPIPDVEVRIGDNNEIQVKGPTVMTGYYNREQASAEAFTEDGWFRTGDAGYIDEAGAVVLTERIKDLFKTSNGKYIAPQAIESRLGEDRYIEQVAVIGDNRKYVSAIIIPAFEALKDYARRHKIDFRNIEDLVNNSEIREFFSKRLEKLQKGLAGFEKIKKFTLLPREFTIENGELTNTLKLRRPVINNRYANVIEAMYC
ncbi:MAG: long-chain fatty acid--CoA ligase [Muribaculaceae bacterium]|nr:long-chain fatty acid--CoA ligase [Muribaculaceae bacterium]